VRAAGGRRRRGFLILIDYGHEARELSSVTHAAGTLPSFPRHRSGGPDSHDAAGAPAWLANPGEQDITAHVDFTSVQAAAEAEGLTTIGFLDQTYFLVGLLPGIPQSLIRSQQLKTLVLPGAMGSALKVLVLGKGVGTP